MTSWLRAVPKVTSHLPAVRVGITRLGGASPQDRVRQMQAAYGGCDPHWTLHFFFLKLSRGGFVDCGGGEAVAIALQLAAAVVAHYADAIVG